jgi:hypothetical protein
LPHPREEAVQLERILVGVLVAANAAAGRDDDDAVDGARAALQEFAVRLPSLRTGQRSLYESA